MDIQEAINNAPEWATHISVRRSDDHADFYNSVEVARAYSKNVNFGRKIDLPRHLFNEILSGNNGEWYFVDIPRTLENE